MFYEIYDFFFSIVINFYSIPSYMPVAQVMASNITLFGVQISFAQYLSMILALISLIFIVVLCCLFVWKIIKLIGNLIK